MLHRLDDGSIRTDQGDIVHFGLARWVQQICVDGHCFLCGIAANAAAFNNEHVVPDWILRRFGLHDKTIVIPNGTTVKYSRYVLPCCAPCNAFLGTTLEAPISEIVAGGFSALLAELQTHGPTRVFSWLALLWSDPAAADSLLS